MPCSGYPKGEAVSHEPTDRDAGASGDAPACLQKGGMSLIEIPVRLLDEIESNSRRLYRGVQTPDADYRQIARDAVSPERAREELVRLLEHLGVEGRGSRLLEIGSGYGLVPAVARGELGIEAFGVEPGEQFAGSYEISQEILRELGCPQDTVRRGAGESLPFADDSFDIVYSSNVLEHVRDPEAVFAEGLRVLRPGGHLCFVVPNYGSWWEGHYGILWIPHLPRSLAKWYVRCHRRDPAFIDTLQLITRPWLERIVQGHSREVAVLGWGQDLWERRLRTLDFSPWACLGRLRRMTAWLHRLGFVGLVVWLGRRLHWETPLVLTVRKLETADGAETRTDHATGENDDG